MDSKQSSSNRSLWIALGALIIGLVIGLVVLGWWLFPVQWTDASPENLLPDYQVDYLLAAVDSFWVTFDSNTALQRYQNLGEDGPSTLATVQADPEANPTQVAAYSAVVEAGGDLGYIEEPAQQGMGNVGKVLIALLLIVLVAALLVWLLFRGRGQEPAGELPPVEPGPAPAVAETTPVVLEETAPEEPLPEAEAAEEVPAEGDTHPVQVSSGQTEPVVTTPAEEPPPLWIPEEEPEQAGPDLGIAGLAAAGLAGAAVAAASEEEAEQPVEEAALEEAAAVAEAGDDTVQTLLDSAGEQAAGGVALGAAALAAGLDESGQPIEPVTIEELAGEEPGLPGEAAAIAGSVVAEEPSEIEPTPVADVEPEAELPTGAAVYQPAQMGYGLAYIEGIGPVYAEKLGEIGISTPGELLERGSTPRGRQEIAEQSGISGRLILEWVNHVDLFRIKGVGSEYADLLEAAGVDTIVELAMRNPDHLHQTMLSVNESKQLVRKPPTQAQVQDWVDQAKTLPRKIYY